MNKSNYHPPTENDYAYLEPFIEAYDIGYKHGSIGGNDHNNPYEDDLSHHERDNSSVGDQQHYQWYRGVWDGYDDWAKQNKK